MSKKIEKTIEWCIYQSRWLQVPVYIGMCVVMGMYSYVFCKDVIHSLMNIETFTEETMLMLAIGIVDVSMVLNLIIVCVIGGYWSFVSRLEIIEKDKDSNQFSYLGKINPNALKHKLMISLISISAVHLLETFVAGNIDTQHTIMQIRVKEKAILYYISFPHSFFSHIFFFNLSIFVEIFYSVTCIDLYVNNGRMAQKQYGLCLYHISV